mmetsp:Transcript_39940/g.78038  ORF Transcript_39940/g.78038 Transcript_39940/m.78038 type:complete len:272 (+) Transcript_39940:723-1538(+)
METQRTRPAGHGSGPVRGVLFVLPQLLPAHVARPVVAGRGTRRRVTVLRGAVPVGLVVRRVRDAPRDGRGRRGWAVVPRRRDGARGGGRAGGGGGGETGEARRGDASAQFHAAVQQVFVETQGVRHGRRRFVVPPGVERRRGGGVGRPEVPLRQHLELRAVGSALRGMAARRHGRRIPVVVGVAEGYGRHRRHRLRRFGVAGVVGATSAARLELSAEGLDGAGEMPGGAFPDEPGLEGARFVGEGGREAAEELLGEEPIPLIPGGDGRGWG